MRHVVRGVRGPASIALAAMAALAIFVTFMHGQGHPTILVQAQAGALESPSVPGVTATAAADSTATVESVFRSALNLHWQAPVPAVANPGDFPQPTDVQKHVADVTNQVHQLYEPGAAADRELWSLNNATRAEADSNFRVLSGGVSRLVISSVHMNGAQANVVGTVDVWSEMNQRMPDGTWIHSKPTQTMDITMKLTNDAGQWKVVTWTGIVTPDTAP